MAVPRPAVLRYVMGMTPDPLIATWTANARAAVKPGRSRTAGNNG